MDVFIIIVLSLYLLTIFFFEASYINALDVQAANNFSTRSVFLDNCYNPCILLFCIESIVIGLCEITFRGDLPVGFVDWLKSIGLSILAGGVTMWVVCAICLMVIFGFGIISGALYGISYYVMTKIFRNKIVDVEEQYNEERERHLLKVYERVCKIVLVLHVIFFLAIAMYCFIH